jgi:hypothetical protein
LKPRLRLFSFARGFRLLRALVLYPTSPHRPLSEQGS